MEASTQPQVDRSQYGPNHRDVGRAVVFTDEHGKRHDALVTAVWAFDGKGLGEVACNLVYVTGDENKSDPYGRQIERRTSVVQRTAQSAHGMFYELP